MDSKKNRKIVENYMEEKGLKSAIFELFETETVKEKIKKGYDEHVSSIDRMISKVPEGLEKNVEKLKSIMNGYTFEDFLDDVRVSFMANQYASINISCMLFGERLESIIIDGVKKCYITDNEDALKDIDEIIGECLKNFSESSLNILYNNYVPEGIPEEVISLIKMLAGGSTIIPATAIFDFDEPTNDVESTEMSEPSEEGNDSEGSEE